MSSRRYQGSALFAVLALLAACGGSPTKDTGETTPVAAATPEAAPQAANDPVDPAVPGKPLDYDPATAAGAVKGVPAPSNTATIEAVANFYTELPGFDLTPLSTKQREKFLHRVNSELCSCGCKNETLAHCLVNDPKCPMVKGLVQSAYDEMKSGG